MIFSRCFASEKPACFQTSFDLVGLVVGMLASYSQNTHIGKLFLGRLCCRSSCEGQFSLRKTYYLCSSDSITLFCCCCFLLAITPGYEAKKKYIYIYTLVIIVFA